MIIVECNTDEFIIRQLGPFRRKIIHEQGKGDVLRSTLKHSNAIGMVDADPDQVQSKFMQQYHQIENYGGVAFFKKNDDPTTRLIQLSPDLEGWLIQRAKQNDISLKQYNLPDSADDLHNIKHVERNKQFKNFIHNLIERDAELKKIKQFILEASQ